MKALRIEPASVRSACRSQSNLAEQILQHLYCCGMPKRLAVVQAGMEGRSGVAELVAARDAEAADDSSVQQTTASTGQIIHGHK